MAAAASPAGEQRLLGRGSMDGLNDRPLARTERSLRSGNRPDSQGNNVMAGDNVRIALYPHDLAMGGSQLSSVELAAAVRDLRHDIVVFSRPGALNQQIDELGLRFVEGPAPRHRPSLAVVRALRSLIESERIDVVHGYEWPPALECLLAARSMPGVTAMATVRSLSVAPFIPHDMPLLVATEQIETAERARGRTALGLLQPHVDLASDSPHGDLAVDEFRHRWKIDPGRYTVVYVSRVAHQLTLEGVITAIDVVRDLSASVPVQLVIVGDGSASKGVRARAAAVNAQCEPHTVVVTGALTDPRPAYAAADVALGMGESALRTMAFAKPLILQGENGFWRTSTPESVEPFVWTGWCGYGDNPQRGAATLRAQLLELLTSRSRRSVLGAFDRELVKDRYSLDRAAAVQVRFYERAIASSSATSLSRRHQVMAGTRFASYHARRGIDRLTRGHPLDDFNAKPVAPRLRRPVRPQAVATERTRDDLIVWLAGSSWDDVAGTERQLVTALSAHRRVLWVEGPTSWLALRRGPSKVESPFEGLSEVSPSITRLRTLAPPGVTRPIVRVIARQLVRRRAAAQVDALGVRVYAVVAAAADAVLPAWRATAATLVYYATDDFVAGARLMDMSARYLRRSRSRNLHAADIALAVSDRLARVLSLERSRVGVLANGCDPDAMANVPHLEGTPEMRLPHPVAGVVGQLNERLDLDVLESVAETGASLLLVGPRCERTAESRVRIDGLVRRTNVQWIDRQPTERMPEILAAIDVGLTPYADTTFNRASFPLKTLEYLAAGLPVVSTDLPATRALATDLIVSGIGPHDFATLTRVVLESERDDEQISARQEFARGHSWASRAGQLLRIIDRRGPSATNQTSRQSLSEGH